MGYINHHFLHATLRRRVQAQRDDDDKCQVCHCVLFIYKYFQKIKSADCFSIFFFRGKKTEKKTQKKTNEIQCIVVSDVMQMKLRKLSQLPQFSHVQTIIGRMQKPCQTFLRLATPLIISHLHPSILPKINIR